jgi:TorA maturation chaperone TorD
MGNSATEVMKLYLEEGLALSPSIRDLPDHILAELEFMSHLSEREASAWESGIEKVKHYLRKQDTFLTNHLTKWVPPFAQGIRSASEQEIYRALAGLTESFIVLDHDYIKALLRGLITSDGKRDDGNSL